MQSLNAKMQSIGGLHGTVGSAKIVKVMGNYEDLENLPSIDGVELRGNKTLTDFGDTPINNQEIQDIIDHVFS